MYLFLMILRKDQKMSAVHDILLSLLPVVEI